VSRPDRTGQVWIDTEGFAFVALLVVGPPSFNRWSELRHPTLVLDRSDSLHLEGDTHNWLEDSPWEEDPAMTRVL